MRFIQLSCDLVLDRAMYLNNKIAQYMLSEFIICPINRTSVAARL